MKMQLSQERPERYEIFSILWGAGKFEGMCACYEERGSGNPLLGVMFPSLEDAITAMDWRMQVLKSPGKNMPNLPNLRAYSWMQRDELTPVVFRNKVSVLFYDTDRHLVLLIREKNTIEESFFGMFPNSLSPQESPTSAVEAIYKDYVPADEVQAVYQDVFFRVEKDTERILERIFKVKMSSENMEKWLLSFYEYMDIKWVTVPELHQYNQQFCAMYRYSLAYGDTIPMLV